MIKNIFVKVFVLVLIVFLASLAFASNDENAEGIENIEIGIIFPEPLPPQIFFQPIITTETNPIITGMVESTLPVKVKLVINGKSYFAEISDNRSEFSEIQNRLWSVTVDEPLSNGAYDIRIIGSNSDKTTEKVIEKGLLITPYIVLDEYNQLINKNNIKIKGTVIATDQVIIKYFLSNTSEITSNLIADESTKKCTVKPTLIPISIITSSEYYEYRFVCEIDQLIEGENQITIVAKHSNSHEETGITIKVISDTILPEIIINTIRTTNTSPIITGKVFDNSEISSLKVTIDNQTYDAIVSGNNWSVQVNELFRKRYDVTVVAEDAAGNVSTETKEEAVIILSGGSLISVLPPVEQNEGESETETTIIQPQVNPVQEPLQPIIVENPPITEENTDLEILEEFNNEPATGLTGFAGFIRSPSGVVMIVASVLLIGVLAGYFIISSTKR